MVVSRWSEDQMPGSGEDHAEPGLLRDADPAGPHLGGGGEGQQQQGPGPDGPRLVPDRHDADPLQERAALLLRVIPPCMPGVALQLDPAADHVNDALELVVGELVALLFTSANTKRCSHLRRFEAALLAAPGSRALAANGIQVGTVLNLCDGFTARREGLA